MHPPLPEDAVYAPDINGAVRTVAEWRRGCRLRLEDLRAAVNTYLRSVDRPEIPAAPFRRLMTLGGARTSRRRLPNGRRDDILSDYALKEQYRA